MKKELIELFGEIQLSKMNIAYHKHKMEYYLEEHEILMESFKEKKRVYNESEDKNKRRD